MHILSKNNNLYFNPIRSRYKFDLTEYVIDYCKNNQKKLDKIIEDKKSTIIKKLPNELFNLIISYTELNLLKNISKNYSDEGGFSIPYNKEWQNSIRIQNPRNACYLVYHSYRDFRFRENGENIIGLRCKDELRCWTEKERILLKKIINSFYDKHFRL